MVFNPFKPHFLLRPRWLVRRCVRQFIPPGASSRVRLDWGVEMNVGPDEIGTAIWRAGVYEIAVSECVWRLLQPDDVAIDAGANIGYMTGLMARRVGPAGSVYAFEPHPEIFRELQENIQLMNSSGTTGTVKAFRMALSDRRWQPTLISDPQFRDNRGTAHLGTAEEDSINATGVEAAPLDELMPSDCTVALMKLDVEGHELSVLRGAERMLRDGRIRNIIYEAHGPNAAAAHQYLDGIGYQQLALGWRFEGPLVGPRERSLSKAYEPPNYVATIDADAPRKLAAEGWTFWRHS